MAALTNTTTSADIANALDQEMVENFTGELSKLTDIIGIISPEVIPAGTALYTYKVSGTLTNGDVDEGDEVPLSKYDVTKTPIGEVPLSKYRKLTTAEAILKGGYENSIYKTDKKMVKDVRSDILDSFFTFLGTGTGTATGTGLQSALAYADAALQTAMEANGDSADRVIHFVNPTDIADYLANAQVTLQTVFGMQYLQTFLGVTDVFVTSRVPENTVYVTPAENIHLYGIDFATLGSTGLSYTTQDGGLIGVSHNVDYTRVSAETHVLSGVLMLAEILNYVVKATITDPNS